MNKVFKSVLTKTEIEVAHLVSLGLSNKEIADKRCNAIITIKGHLNQIFKKLNLKNRSQLIVLAAELKAKEKLFNQIADSEK